MRIYGAIVFVTRDATEQGSSNVAAAAAMIPPFLFFKLNFANRTNQQVKKTEAQ
jgi:hypothetical protein